MVPLTSSFMASDTFVSGTMAQIQFSSTPGSMAVTVGRMTNSISGVIMPAASL